MTTVLDRSRRYLVPVARLDLPDEPDVTHLAVYEWHEVLDAWMTGAALCGYSTTQGALPEGTLVTCERCEAYRAEYEEILACEKPVPPVKERVAARRDPRHAAVLEVIADFDWPNGQKMVPGSRANQLATRVMVAVRAAGEIRE